MARTCTVCRHGKRKEVEKALVASEPYRGIAARFGLSQAALIRHKADHLLDSILKAQAARDLAGATDVATELVMLMERVRLIYEACHRYLLDPEDETRYDIGPRADDIEVTYFVENGDGKPHKRKEKLSELLRRAKVAMDNEAPYLVETKYKDPRDLALAAMGEARKQLEFLAELQGKLQRQPQFNVLVAPEFIIVRDAVIGALAKHPEARVAVAKALKEVGE